MNFPPEQEFEGLLPQNQSNRGSSDEGRVGKTGVGLTQPCFNKSTEDLGSRSKFLYIMHRTQTVHDKINDVPGFLVPRKSENPFSVCYFSTCLFVYNVHHGLCYFLYVFLSPSLTVQFPPEGTSPGPFRNSFLSYTRLYTYYSSSAGGLPVSLSEGPFFVHVSKFYVFSNCPTWPVVLYSSSPFPYSDFSSFLG